MTLCYKCILTPLHHCSKAHILTTTSWDYLGGKSLRVPVTADGMCYSTRTKSPMCFTWCWLPEISSLLPLGFLCHIFQPDTAPKRVPSPHRALLLCGVNWHVGTLYINKFLLVVQWWGRLERQPVVYSVTWHGWDAQQTLVGCPCCAQRLHPPPCSTGRNRRFLTSLSVHTMNKRHLSGFLM